MSEIGIVAPPVRPTSTTFVIGYAAAMVVMVPEVPRYFSAPDST